MLLLVIQLFISCNVFIIFTEALHNDIKLELFATRSATNSSSHLKPYSHDMYFTSKNALISNVVNAMSAMPSNIISGQVIPNSETGKHIKVVGGGGGNLLTRCYGIYGCFSIVEPFLSLYRPINLFPVSPEILDVMFLLKTRKNAQHFEKLIYREDGTISSKYFNPKNELKIIIHGYIEHGFQSWIKKMVIEFLSKDDYNVISIDWMAGAIPPYTQAVANARLVGAIIANFIKSIQKTYPSYSASMIHIIGHSLGAHIAGYAGERTPELARITGLDPAEPYFQNTDIRVRLDASDASFVDVIHTDASSIITGGFGMSQSCGHVDFYPNGGTKQPGCSDGAFKSVIDSIGKERNVIHGIRRFLNCNHIRAFLLFTESINSECPFMAYECSSFEDFTNGRCTQEDISECGLKEKIFDNNNSTDNNNYLSCLQMGFNADVSFKKGHKFPNKEPNQVLTKIKKSQTSKHSSTAMYFLQTSDQNPYCQYHYHIKIQSTSRNELYISNVEKGRLFIQIFGSRGSTQYLEASKETLQFGSGESIEFIISSNDLGNIIRVELHWKSSSAIINPLRWRVLETPSIFLHQITISNLETNYRVTICGEDMTLKAQHVKILFIQECEI